MTERLKYKRNPDYLSNDDLVKEIELSKAQKKLTDKAWAMLILMTKRLNRKFNYYYDGDRDDVIQHSYFIILKYWDKFDATKSTNAFAYYTEIIKRAHVQSFTQLNKTRKDSISINNFYNDGEDMNI